MFGNKSKTAEQSDTIISESVRITGNISFRGVLKIDGIVEGDVSLLRGSEQQGSEQISQLIVGAKGSIKGTIAADSIVISGRVKGDIHSKKRLELLNAATVEGDVFYKELLMDIGTKFSGKLEPRYAIHIEDKTTKVLPTHQNAELTQQKNDPYIGEQAALRKSDDQRNAYKTKNVTNANKK